MKILITGGAGFIGSHVARLLLRKGHEVSILDNFSPQIHGTKSDLAPDLRDSVELFPGDVRDIALCERALHGCTGLIHLAAETGTGQSMYRVRHYTDVNVGGTSGLMELLLTGKYPVQSLVVASSRAVYGEGAARCAIHGSVYPHARGRAAMEARDFAPKCPACGHSTEMLPTSEDAPLRPSSLYGLTKLVQEEMVLMYAASLNMNGFALRYANVYGPGQSLKNPYTGILAIFSNQARANAPIYVFEDGQESRDFVHVEDVAEATVRCTEAPAQSPSVLNVGTGVAVPVATVVQLIVAHLSSRSEVAVTGAFREGDIRHNCVSVEKLRATLGFVPAKMFDEGLQEFLAWVGQQEPEGRNYEKALAEMRSVGLMHG